MPSVRSPQPHRLRLAHRPQPGPAAAGLVALLVAATGCSSPAVSAADCPYPAGPPVVHAVVVEDSPSERAPAIQADRLDRIGHHARQAAGCGAELVVVTLTRGRSAVVYNHRLKSTLGTPQARHLDIGPLADGALAQIRPRLEELSQADPQPGSDPGAAFRALSELLLRIDPAATVDALILSDGVSQTDSVNLNRPITAAEVEALADQVAPRADLGGRVRIDWPALGHTADPTGPPGSWLEQLRALWDRVCRTRNAASCTITTI